MYKRWWSSNNHRFRGRRKRRKTYDEWSFWSVLGDVVEGHFRGKTLMFKSPNESFFDDPWDTNDSELPFFDKKEDAYIDEKEWNDHHRREVKNETFSYGDLDLRISNLEHEVESLEEDHRRFKYSVDDEFEYTHKRNNRKFRRIEKDIESLHKKNS